MILSEVSEMKYRRLAFGCEMRNSGTTRLMPGFGSAPRPAPWALSAESILYGECSTTSLHWEEMPQ